jgi:hypothetical protein
MISIYSGVCRIYTLHYSIQLRYHSLSVHLMLLLRDVLRGYVGGSVEMQYEAGKMRTWRHYSSEFRDIPGFWEWASLVMHLETVIVQTWRVESLGFGATLGGQDGVNLVMQPEIGIQGVKRFTWGPRCCELDDIDSPSLESVIGQS